MVAQDRQAALADLVTRLDRGLALIEAAEDRGAHAEADRLRAHWRRLDDEYRTLYDELAAGAE